MGVTRRQFVLVSGSVLAGAASNWLGVLASREAHADTAYNPLNSLEECYISYGDYQGGYVVAPLGVLNWYFANLGLYPFVRRQPARTKAYLNLYLRHARPDDGTIRDVNFNYTTQSPYNFPVLEREDSHDSYAATFASLAIRYYRLTGDRVWLNANLQKIKRIVYLNIVAQQKPNGLISVFQKGKGASTGYLMDGAECYRALKDFSDLLRELGQPEWTTYSRAATRLAQALDSLFDNRVRAYRFADIQAGVGNTFYADAVCQVFCQVYNVPQGNPSTQASYYDGGYAYLNRLFPRWPYSQEDANRFPWMMLGYAAVKRGDIARADLQMRVFRGIATNSSTRAKATINEVGWYQRISDWRAGVRY